MATLRSLYLRRWQPGFFTKPNFLAAQPAPTSTIAWAKACGASCGRLWPMPPGNGPVLVFAREFLRVSARLQVWRAISVAFKRDGGHRDHGGLRELLFQIVIF